MFRIVVSPGAHNDTLSARWRDKNHLQVSSTTESGAHLYFYMLNFIDARRTVFLRDVKANDDRIVEVGRRGDRHLTAAADHRALANALLRNVDPVFGHLGHSPSVHESIAISTHSLFNYQSCFCYLCEYCLPAPFVSHPGFFMSLGSKRLFVFDVLTMIC